MENKKRSQIMYSERLINSPNNEHVYALPSVVRNNGVFSTDCPFTTLYDGFYHGWQQAKKYGDCRLLGHRVNGEGPFKWMDYKQVESACTAFASRTASLGLKKGDMVGIYSRTRMEWILTFMGCQFRSLIAVPLYDTLGDDSILYILRQTEFRIVVVSMPSEVRKLINMWDDTVKIRYIVVIDWPSEATADKTVVKEWDLFIEQDVTPKGVTCESFENFTKQGEANPFPHEPPNPDDIFEICYTSGTTGKPKGAIYQHNRMVSEIFAIRSFIRDHLKDSIYEVFLCYLPLAHAYELAVECFCLMYGYKMGYFNGNPRKILDDIQVLQPTILAAVPRVLSRIHEGIVNKTSRQEAGLIRSMLFKLALRQKIHAMKRGDNRETIIDKLFFKRLHTLLGGKLKAIFVGSSATHPVTMQMLRATLGCHICEGYGQTETFGVTFIQHPTDSSTKTIGAPLEHIQFKVIDVPHLHYFASNLEGELCIKSPSTIKAYYKNPEETKKTIDTDNWVHTGDVIKINANGTVSIIDRVKEFFKLAQGEYVIPNKVETAYLTCPEIENIFVWGDPLKTCCVAIVFPQMDMLANSLKEVKINVDKSNFHKSKQVREHLLKKMENAAVKNGLKGFEKAKNIYISSIPLTDYNNLLTPTMKIRRHAFVKHFEREIAVMYEGIVDKPF